MTGESARKRLVVGIGGASGAILAVEVLRALKTHPAWEAHLVISQAAMKTIDHETPHTVAEVEALAARCYPIAEIGAAIASGTFKTAGMVIVPCSMKTVAGIAAGFSDTLLLRAADVTLKEQRKLVLVARETPLSAIHLKNLAYLASCGVMILPPVLTYYHHPRSVEDMTRHIVGKILDVFGIEMDGFRRWGGLDRTGGAERAAPSE